MRALAVALALQLRLASAPVEVIERCRNDLKEVEASVNEAIEKVHKAQSAVAAEQEALAAAKQDHKEVSADLAERQQALAAELESVQRLELAVRDFADALESRRQALDISTQRLEEKEALRNAYRDVVGASELALKQLEKEPLVEDTTDAVLVREQHLEMKRAALSEEQERLKTVDAEVQVELKALESEVTVWQADRKRHEVFKGTLDDKVSAAAKLQLAVEALEKKQEAIEELIGINANKADGVSQAMGASEEHLNQSLHDLIGKQGAAVDLLEQSLRQCVLDSEKQADAAEDHIEDTEEEAASDLAAQEEASEKALDKVVDQHQAATEEHAGVESALKQQLGQAKEEVAAAETALAAEKAREPTRTEALEAVKEKVQGTLSDSIRDFVDKLAEVEGADKAPAPKSEPKAEPMAAPKSEAKGEEKDFESKLGELVSKLPSSK